MLLPEAFRSLSRLSSALSAKASTIRSYQHNQPALDSRVGVASDTCIALHALVIGQLFLLGFLPRILSNLVHVVNNITSDVLIDIYILSFISLYAIFKVHSRCFR